MSKFDVILIIIGLFILAACGADFWLIINDYPEFGGGFWSVILGIATGEVVSFSIYRMVKRVQETKLPRALTGKHALIQEMEDTEEIEGVNTDGA